MQLVCGLGGIEPEAALLEWTRTATRPFLRKTEPEAALPKRGNYGMNVILKIVELFAAPTQNERKEPAAH